MVDVAKEMERRGLDLPLLIGGATTSRQHTAVRIAPEYSQRDRARPRRLAGRRRRLRPARPRAARRARRREPRADQERLREQHAEKRAHAAAPDRRTRARNREPVAFDDLPVPAFTGTRTSSRSSPTLRGVHRLAVLLPRLGAEGQVTRRSSSSRRRASSSTTRNELLDEIVATGSSTPRGVYGFWPAHAEGDDVVLDERRPLPVLRQQAALRRLAAEPLPRRLRRARRRPRRRVRGRRSTAPTSSRPAYEAEHDDYRAIMVKALADRLAEAFAEYLHQRARREWYEPDERLAERRSDRGALPRHPARVRLPGLPRPHREGASSSTCSAPSRRGLELTESFAMTPAAAVSGLYFGHPAVALLLGRPHRPRPGRGLRGAEGRRRGRGRALAPAEPRLRAEVGCTTAK